MFGTRRVSVSPVPRPSRAGSWADRGRPQAGLRHAPCAAALFAFKSPSWGVRGEGTGTGSWRGPFVLGLTRPRLLSLYARPWRPAAAEMSPVGLAGRGARSPSGKARQTVRGTRGSLGAPSRPQPGPAPFPAPPEGAAVTRRGSCPTAPSPRAGVLGGRSRNGGGAGHFHAHPIHFLPPFLGNKGASGSEPLQPRPASALSVGSGVSGSAPPLSALGEGRGWGRTPRPPTACPLTPPRGSRPE